MALSKICMSGISLAVAELCHAAKVKVGEIEISSYPESLGFVQLTCRQGQRFWGMMVPGTLEEARHVLDSMIEFENRRGYRPGLYRAKPGA